MNVSVVDQDSMCRLIDGMVRGSEIIEAWRFGVWRFGILVIADADARRLGVWDVWMFGKLTD